MPLVPKKKTLSFHLAIKQSGFTLLELMLVVGMIGVLVTISSTQYDKYSRKARQSEAKIALGAIYVLEKSFYSEYSAYIPAMDAIGYAPEGFRNYYQVGSGLGVGSYSGSVSGYSGSKAICNFPTLNSPYPLAGAGMFGGPAPNPCNNQGWGASNTCSAYPDNPQNFYGVAYGNIGNTSANDYWQINELKELQNCMIGI
jgi:prepilin-type N-terminal cleavage/methylation domain-containing protein